MGVIYVDRVREMPSYWLPRYWGLQVCQIDSIPWQPSCQYCEFSICQFSICLRISQVLPVFKYLVSLSVAPCGIVVRSAGRCELPTSSDTVTLLSGVVVGLIYVLYASRAGSLRPSGAAIHCYHKLMSGWTSGDATFLALEKARGEEWPT